MHGIDQHHVIVTIAMQDFIQYVNVQLFVVYMRLHAWINPNRAVSAQTNNNIVTKIIKKNFSRKFNNFNIYFGRN